MSHFLWPNLPPHSAKINYLSQAVDAILHFCYVFAKIVRAPVTLTINSKRPAFREGHIESAGIEL